VVLGVERKLLSKLQEPAKSEKLVEIDRHCACAMSGIVGDARVLVDHARVEAQNHKFNYVEPQHIKLIAEAVSDLAMNFGEGYEGSKKKPMARPYGVALLIAGVDENGPQLFQTDPSGTCFEYKARAIGSGGDTAMTTLKEKYNEDLTIGEAERLALQLLKQVMEDKISVDNVEVCVITTEKKQLEFRTQAEIGAILERLE
jgi:20S proteasome subunit alpha 5